MVWRGSTKQRSRSSAGCGRCSEARVLVVRFFVLQWWASDWPLSRGFPHPYTRRRAGGGTRTSPSMEWLRSATESVPVHGESSHSAASRKRQIRPKLLDYSRGSARMPLLTPAKGACSSTHAGAFGWCRYIPAREPVPPRRMNTHVAEPLCMWDKRQWRNGRAANGQDAAVTHSLAVLAFPSTVD